MTDEHVEVDHVDDRVEIRVAGDIDMANADAVGEQILSAISNRSTVVELDLTEVTYLDSAGLRVLSLLAGRLHRLQIDFRVVAPTGSPARHVIDLTGMTEFIHVGLGDPPDPAPR